MSEKNTTPVVATMRINGEIEPGTIICPETVAELDELRALKAVEDCSEADLAVYKAQQKGEPAKRAPRRAAAEEAAPAAADAADAAPAGDDAADAIG